MTGTPLYLAPELLGGAPASVRSDIYGLGVLLYHLVTGGYPVKASSLDELRRAHAADARRRLTDVRPDLPEEFVGVVHRALERDPARRFASAGAMADALSQTLTADSWGSDSGKAIVAEPVPAESGGGPAAVLARLARRPAVWAAIVAA